MDEEDTAELAEVESPETLPGPVLVAAKRLLFKRLWRLGLITNLQRPQLMQAGRALAVHALDRRWDTHPFWGWDAAGREAAMARFGPGNDVFAEAAWGSPWGDDWETGEFEDVDLPARDPAQVVDILGAVEAVVHDLQAAKAAVASD